jgi:hypothetical protein
VLWVNLFDVTGLSHSTGYIAFFTAEDMSGNLQPIVQSTTFTTQNL